MMTMAAVPDVAPSTSQAPDNMMTNESIQNDNTDATDRAALAENPEQPQQDQADYVSQAAAAAAWPSWYESVRPHLSSTLQARLDPLIQKHGLLLPLTIVVGVAAILVALLSSSRGAANHDQDVTEQPAPPQSMIISIIVGFISLLRLTVGVSIGLGLGLGFAAHVYDVLTVWKEQEVTLLRATATTTSGRERGLLSRSASSGGGGKSSNSLLRSAFVREQQQPSSYGLVDEQTYASLMQSAGYDVPDKILRGQVLRASDSLFRNQHNYSYYGNKPLQLLQHMYPVLPLSVKQPLAQLMDYVVRDFCATWCCKLDAGCENSYTETGDLVQPAKRVEDDSKDKDDNVANTTATSTQHPRRMVYQLNPYRNVAIMEQLYQSLTIVFGNLATRTENVNVFELFLLKATKVLAHTFKVYRTLRKSVMLKNKAHQLGKKAGTLQLPPMAPTEMQMTKEFLLAGKLHRAVTFGLDVPSLLFADGQGKECGWPNSGVNNASAAAASDDERVDPDKLLEERLFNTGLIAECEIDYNRVLAHRMVRALLARNDFGCGIVSSIITEILGECVLPPLMSCFSPEYLNSWIVTGLSTVPAGLEAAVAATEEGVEVDGDQSLLPDSLTLEAGGALVSNGIVEAVDTVKDESSRKAEASELDNELADTDCKKVEIVESMDDADQVATIEPPPDALDDAGDKVNALLAMTLIDLQQFVDFEDFRLSKSQNEPVTVDWDDPGCREAILRLVLVIEQTLTNGRCTYKPLDPPIAARSHDVEPNMLDEDGVAEEGAVEITLPEYESTTLTQILMELTSDLDAFEERVASENTFGSPDALAKFDEMEVEDYKITSTDQSTLRTLIAAWLHTGQIYRVITVLVQARTSVLVPYFGEHAFLQNSANASGFVRQLKALDGVEILVDTMMVLSAPRLDETSREDLNALVQKSVQTSSKSTSMASPSSIIAMQQMTTSSTPRYLDFNRNESFASSLRAERERRMRSWQHVLDESDAGDGLPILCHASASEGNAALHRELHRIARVFYSGTSMIAIRDAARSKKSIDDGTSLTESIASEASVPVSLLTVETASARRRIEIPDDDSSFLLRAQPRPLNAVGVHRDQQNHDQSFKCFAATYDEPAINRSENFSGGRYIRSCLVRYFPIDRTATVALQESNSRKLDQRHASGSIPDTITVGQSARAGQMLSVEFLKERHLCQRWTPKGTQRSQGIMSSSILEPTDFNLMPRTGKAIDFVYRSSLFERPMVDLGGKHFTVNDSTSLGTHRSDASSLELSDAMLSAALSMLGQELSLSGSGGLSKNMVEMGDDGYPIVWIKFSNAESDSQVEIKPYRVSFVRAALLVTSARHEAQLQNLLACVREGSVKKATKALTDRRLRPTATVLEYASSGLREKQSVVLRDLKLGVNHIDREQLRRNGLLNPRYPTIIRELTATLEDVVESTRSQGNALFGASDTMYKIRCQAVVEVQALSSELRGDPTFQAADGSIAKTMREEWVVLRSYDDFNKFHKHLKTQVAANESSGNAGTRLVGAATAAFAAGAAVAGGSGIARNRQRMALIPSLGQASKASLGPVKKLILKRREALSTYLSFLLAPRHLLNRCTELLIFLGAIYPLPSEILPNQVVLGVTDPLGRTDMSRKIIQSRLGSVKTTGATTNDAYQTDGDFGNDAEDLLEDDDSLDDEDDENRERKSNMIPAIESKINKVPLTLVRRQLFELLHYLFGFENASFVRNRMLTALKTMSFAVTTGGEFRRTLYRLHCEKLSADAVGDLITFALGLIWPDGVFLSKATPATPSELKEQSRQAMDALHSSFPDQIRSILGQELTRDGLNMLHEMLQNRLVVKSLFYILMDMLWLEVFPELGDVAECGAVLDVDNTK